MTLRILDTSGNNKGVPDATINADGIIFKATEGIGFVDSDCDPSYQEAKAAGKLLGVYGFARPDGNQGVDEANYFVDQVQGYVGEAILVLDWEHSPTNEVWWAKAWLDQVYARTGVRPLIYMNTSTANGFDWSPVWHDYALWVAQYADMSPDVNWDMSNSGPAPVVNWPNGYVGWQWTSTGRIDGYAGNLDCSEFYMDRDQWKAYATPRQNQVAPAPNTAPAPQDVPAPAPTPVPTPAPVIEPTPAPVQAPVVEPTVTETPAPVVTPAAPAGPSKLSAALSFIRDIAGLAAVKSYLHTLFTSQTGLGRTIRTSLQVSIGLVGFMVLIVDLPSFKDFWLSQPILTGWAAPATVITIVTAIWNVLGKVLSYYTALSE